MSDFRETVGKRLDAAIKLYQHAQQEIVHCTIHQLCTLVREEYPQARTVEFEWSDQGAWLELSTFNTTEDFDDDIDDGFMASNLDDTCEHVWGTYMQVDEHRGNRLVLDIDAALTRSALELRGLPTDPDEIEEFLNS